MIQTSQRNTMPPLGKIRWACRRGMLELDVLLGNFFEQVFAQMKVADQLLFIELLEASDFEIFAWLLAYVKAPKLFVPLVARIRAYASSNARL